jgi:Mn2+/Fe2+ NRAMP family transporter
MGKEKRLTWGNFILLLGVLGPGIIVNMVDNDAGGITTYSAAGARYGYAIIWIMIPSLLLLYMVQEMNARMGIVTGKGLAALIRERFSLRLTAVIMLSVMIANFANTVGEFAGVAASSELFGVSKYIAVPLVAVAVWYMVLKGSYRIVEKIFLVISLVYITYIIAAIMAKPDWGAVARGTFVPSVQSNVSWIIMVITVIGTTIAPWMQFWQQSAVVDKGLGIKDLAFERFDTGFGAALAVIDAIFIIICCAAAFFNKAGVGATQITTAEQAARGLAPIAGQYASYLFAIGLLNAGVFAASILPMSSAYAVCEAFGWESGVDRSFSEAPKFYIIYTLFIFGGAAFILIPKIPLVTVMLISQTINGVFLPIVVTCMLLIINDRETMGNYVNGDKYNVVAWGAVALLYILDIWLVITGVFPIGR